MPDPNEIQVDATRYITRLETRLQSVQRECDILGAHCDALVDEIARLQKLLDDNGIEYQPSPGTSNGNRAQAQVVKTQ